jgi:hypothetical protein
MAYRYQSIKTRKLNNNGNTYYVNTIYPDIPVSNNDQYLYTTIGDRLDLLAHDIYKDQTLWWILASANNLPGDSLYPPVGMQLRVPANIQAAITKFNSINGLR